ncbi:uncharacterized protein LAESUDRAFT_727951 [Laetiporus sulphureus 93-53]|uniref:Uncharacterized protein n=1 Tax=Laetiporus sulphureus 93-53 TaxID=1314785 RepID=A0A165DB88_9APHY|nr:uncharacterized protein LAESUDRAFT_727951 [Laetiporus sulphureus 93-53]KZT04474.1 hypothetical protein LAESUDRAFT_727951 [Laetiporus sulphureus 93-53]
MAITRLALYIRALSDLLDKGYRPSLILKPLFSCGIYAPSRFNIRHHIELYGHTLMDEPRVKDSVIQSLPDTNQTPLEEIDSVSPEPELANPDRTSNEGQSSDVSSVPEREPSPQPRL